MSDEIRIQLQPRTNTLQSIDSRPPFPDFDDLLSSTLNYNHTPLVSVVSDAERHYDEGVEQIKNGDYSFGITNLKLAIRLRPDYAEACCRRACEYLGEYLNLDTGYDKTIANRRDNTIKFSDETRSKASAYFDAATSRNPGYADAYYYRGLAKLNNLYILVTQPYWDSSGRAERAFNYGDAVHDFSKVIELNPEDDRAYKYRAIAWRELHECEVALADFDAAVRLNPNDVETYKHRAIAHSRLKQYVAVVTDYDEAIRIIPDDPQLYTNRAFANRELGRYADAIADFDASLKFSPDIIVLCEREDVRRLATIADCDAAIRGQTNDANAYSRRGCVRLEIRKYESAVVDFDEAIRLEPASVEAFKHRGIAKLKLGQYEQAIADFDEAIRLNPDDAELYKKRIAAKRRLKEAGLLLTYCEHIGMQLWIPDDEAHRNEIAARQQHLESLLKDYDNLLRLEPENRTAHLYRGAVNLDLGEHGAAFADFDDAVKLNPDDGLAYLKRAEAMFSLLMNDLRAAGNRDRRLERYIDNLIERMLSELNPYPLRLERFKPTLF